MKSVVDTARAKIAELNHEAQLLQDFILAYQRVCEHEWVDDHSSFNPHTREEYVKCTICGVVK